MATSKNNSFLFTVSGYVKEGEETAVVGLRMDTGRQVRVSLDTENMRNVYLTPAQLADPLNDAFAPLNSVLYSGNSHEVTPGVIKTKYLSVMTRRASQEIMLTAPVSIEKNDGEITAKILNLHSKPIDSLDDLKTLSDVYSQGLDSDYKNLIGNHGYMVRLIDNNGNELACDGFADSTGSTKEEWTKFIDAAQAANYNDENSVVDIIGAIKLVMSEKDSSLKIPRAKLSNKAYKTESGDAGYIDSHIGLLLSANKQTRLITVQDTEFKAKPSAGANIGSLAVEPKSASAAAAEKDKVITPVAVNSPALEAIEEMSEASRHKTESKSPENKNTEKTLESEEKEKPSFVVIITGHKKGKTSDLSTFSGVRLDTDEKIKIEYSPKKQESAYLVSADNICDPEHRSHVPVEGAVFVSGATEKANNVYAVDYIKPMSKRPESEVTIVAPLCINADAVYGKAGNKFVSAKLLDTQSYAIREVSEMESVCAAALDGSLSDIAEVTKSKGVAFRVSINPTTDKPRKHHFLAFDSGGNENSERAVALMKTENSSSPGDQARWESVTKAMTEISKGGPSVSIDVVGYACFKLKIYKEEMDIEKLQSSGLFKNQSSKSTFVNCAVTIDTTKTSSGDPYIVNYMPLSNTMEPSVLGVFDRPHFEVAQDAISVENPYIKTTSGLGN